MYNWRWKAVFLILIISTCIHLAPGQYNENKEQIKCCDNYDDDKSSGNVLNGDEDSIGIDVQENGDQFVNDLSPSLLERLHSNGAFNVLTSSCIRIMLQTILAASRLQSSAALNFDHLANQSDESSIYPEISPHHYVLYCNNTSLDSIDGFVSELMNDKTAANAESNIRYVHSTNNHDALRGIILLNVPLNNGYINHLSEITHHNNQLAIRLNSAEFFSWRKSQLNSDLFNALMQKMVTNQPNAFVQLKHLDLSDNNLTNLAGIMFDHLLNLQTLNLSKNAINNKHIHPQLFQHFPQIQHLDLSHNQITSIVYERLYESFAGSKESLNNIKPIKNHNGNSNQPMARVPQPEGLFVNMAELRELILNHNQINDLPRNTFVTNGLPKLHFLNLAHNQLSVIPFQIFQSLSALRYLDLSSNRLVTFLDNFFIENDALTVLSLRNNTIDKVLANSFYGLRHLIELDLSENHIRNIDRNAFDSLDSLQRLNLCMNNLSMIPTTLFHRLHQLKFLNLSRNKFKILPNGVFAHQFALEHLTIDETSLQKLNNWVSRKPNEINKEILTRLRFISLRNNPRFHEIDAVTFSSLPAVEYLNLTGNGLTILPHEIGELTELKQLDISENDLISIPKQLSTLQHLDTISMTGNRYECDCQMVWLAAWMNETRKRAFDSTLNELRPPFNQLHVLKCRHGYPGDLLRVLQHLKCFKPTAMHVSESKVYLLRSDAQLECEFSGNPVADIIWITPLNKIIPWYADPDAKPLSLNTNLANGTENAADPDHLAKRNREKMEHHILKQKHINFSVQIEANEVTLLENGSLRVHNISRKDSGLYICYGYNVMGYTSAEIRYV